MAELAARVYPHGVPKASDNRGLYVGEATDGIIEAVARLLDLMVRAEDAELLGPLVIDEILIRLLRTPTGARVAQIGSAESTFGFSAAHQPKISPGCARTALRAATAIADFHSSGSRFQ